MGAYAASKFAMEAVTDCLRQELYPWGISVSAIEPGFIKTPLVGNLASTYDQSIKDLNPEVGRKQKRKKSRLYTDGLSGKGALQKRVGKHKGNPTKDLRESRHHSGW